MKKIEEADRWNLILIYNTFQMRSVFEWQFPK